MTKKYFYFQNKQNNESSASTDVMAPQGPYLNIIKRKKKNCGNNLPAKQWNWCFFFKVTGVYIEFDLFFCYLFKCHNVSAPIHICSVAYK